MTQVTHVIVAEAFVDGEAIWSGTYPNATKKQAIAYAQSAAPVQEFLRRGIAVCIEAKKFMPTDDADVVEVRGA